jgi:hypothetical protein
MRQNLIIALLSIACTLLAVNLYVTLSEPRMPLAFGQAVGTPTGSVALATGVTQGGSETMLYLYDLSNQRLAAYSTKNQGIELKGVRHITHDLKAVEFVARGKSPSVQEMKKAIGTGGAAGGEEDEKKTK